MCIRDRIGGIGVGYSAGYAWQTVFNTFGALAVAASIFGLEAALIPVSYTHLKICSTGDSILLVVSAGGRLTKIMYSSCRIKDEYVLSLSLIHI